MVGVQYCFLLALLDVCNLCESCVGIYFLVGGNCKERVIFEGRFGENGAHVNRNVVKFCVETVVVKRESMSLSLFLSSWRESRG